MLVAVIGGKLQGVEAVYLAQKAGFQTLLIDKDSRAPAKGLCDAFLEFEFSAQTPHPWSVGRIDLIIPAVEDREVLALLDQWAGQEKIPIALDLAAYDIACSKLRSGELFNRMNLPAPAPWPGCAFPVIVKPDSASGSRGVRLIHTHRQLLLSFSTKKQMDNSVIQEFVTGPSFSIEVVGRPGKYRALQVTDLKMDADFDCRQVRTPTRLDKPLVKAMEALAVDIAEEIGLFGIMDLEVILHQNELKVLEIDARLPSQTPMAVFHSSGINMVEYLARAVRKRRLPRTSRKKMTTRAGHVLVEHIRVNSSGVECLGEHIMAQDGPLKTEKGFFGADEAITSYAPGKKEWVATMIFTGPTRLELGAKRDRAYSRIRETATQSPVPAA